jgi:Nucleotide-binding protein implicated in inhibition of septum formation
LFYSGKSGCFYELNDKQIKDYIATGSPFDKAGGYGIQDSGFVKEIIGSYDNVMGLPTEEIELHLNKQI